MLQHWEDEESVTWARDRYRLPWWTLAVTVTGNEDCPARVEAFASNAPTIFCGKLVVDWPNADSDEPEHARRETIHAPTAPCGVPVPG